MGSSCTVCSKDEYDEEDEEAVRFRHYEEKSSPASIRHHSTVASPGGGGGRMNTVALLASMAHQAGGFMNQMAVTQASDVMDPSEFQARVRRAKGEMRTVSVRNDCLYIDYEFIGRVPDGMGIY
jgi:hypothetical protein